METAWQLRTWVWAPALPHSGHLQWHPSSVVTVTQGTLGCPQAPVPADCIPSGRRRADPSGTPRVKVTGVQNAVMTTGESNKQHAQKPDLRLYCERAVLLAPQPTWGLLQPAQRPSAVPSRPTLKSKQLQPQPQPQPCTHSSTRARGFETLGQSGRASGSELTHGPPQPSYAGGGRRAAWQEMVTILSAGMAQLLLLWWVGMPAMWAGLHPMPACLLAWGMKVTFIPNWQVATPRV